MPSDLIAKALEIARKRREILLAMREAIRAGDKNVVFELARRLTGLGDEESHRTGSSVN
jgi:hypothetical protein